MGAVVESCCSSAVPGAVLEATACESPLDRADPCGCNLVPRDEAPAVPVRIEPDVRASAMDFAHGFQATEIDVGQLAVAIDSPVLPVHARPLRVLYGVWRN
jgi:hypothetical protein